MRHILFALSFILGSMFASVATAQNLYDVDTKPPRGFMPTSDQLASPMDNIDALNGKLHLQIPLGSLPRGRAGTSFDVDLVYDSHLYDIIPSVQPPIPPYMEPRYIQELAAITLTGGWTYNFRNYRLDFEEQAGVCEAGGPTRLYRFQVLLPDGSSHVLHLNGYEQFSGGVFNGDGYLKVAPDGWVYPCQGTRYPSGLPGPFTYYTADGSYLKFQINMDGSDWSTRTWRLFFPDGRRVVHNGLDSPNEPFTSNYVYDPNGNRVRIVSSCYDPFPQGTCNMPYTLILDDSDRAVQIDYNVTNGGPTDTQKRDTVTAPGPNGNIVWTIDWELLHIGGDQRKYQWTSSPPLDQTQFQDIDFHFWTVKYVQLPLASASTFPDPPSQAWNTYEFRYSDNADEGYGELDYMKTPSGAEYNYGYKWEQYSMNYLGYPTTKIIAHDNSINDKTITHDAITDLHWIYTFDDTSSTITNPDGGVIVNTFNVKNNPSDWSSGLIARIDDPNGSVRKRIWAQNKPYELRSVGAYKTPNNPFIQRETATVGNALGQPSKTAVTEFVYDKNGNLRTRAEYDWVPYAGQSVETGTTIQRLQDLTYYVTVPLSLATTNDANAYWQSHNPSLWPDPASARRLDAVQRRNLSPNGPTIQAATEFDYDYPYTKGNVTAEKRWDSVKSPNLPGLGGLSAANSQVLTRAYDPNGNGNLTDIYEPEVRTRITYDSQGNAPTRVDHAYGTSAQRSWEYVWTSNGTAITSKKDLDNNLTTSFTYDNVGRRLTQSESGLRRMQTIYDDANLKVTTKRDLAAFQDGKIQMITRYDQLGRVSLMQTSDGQPLISSTDGIKVASTYIEAVGGRRVVTSTPYRTTSDTTLEWTCTQYDQSGRVTAMAMFKGSAPPAQNNCESTTNRTGIARTAYDSDETKIVDPASKTRKQRLDALGRLVEVVEDPDDKNYSTTYDYDTLDHLTHVFQGAQTRTFAYSSLGRLVSATNPESGTTGYTYYDSGDLYTRTDARNIVTTMTYDPLHRILTKTYSDGTPTATYEYYLAGTSTSPKIGQSKSVSSNAASTTYNSYTALGQVTSSTQMIDGYDSSLTFTYSWWLNNALKKVRYPSLRIVNYTVDDAGRNTKVFSPAKTYADMTAGGIMNPYAPDGRLAQTRLGNGLYDTRDFQTPGMPTLYKLGTTLGGTERLRLAYDFDATQNNGNPTSHTITNGATSWTQSFTYDGLNRLATSAETGGFNRTYGYDRYGNRWVSAASGLLSPADVHEPTVSTNFDAANRIVLQGSAFDAAGNQTIYTPYTLSYDAENRNTAATSASNGSMTLAYDGEGRRVKKAWTPGGGSPITTYYLYDALGQLAAEYSNGAPTAGTSYPFTDMLGSLRAVTTSTGTLAECYDYLPFGRMLGSADNGRSSAGCYPNLSQLLSSRLPQKFTGKERDAETSLDFFGARYFSGAQGRFVGVDPSLVSVDKSNPQSWNRFAYTYNNPMKYVDPNGKWPTAIHSAILAGAFSGLSGGQLKAIQLGSRSVDFSIGGQLLASRAHEHGMQSPAYTPNEARMEAEVFTFEHERLAFDATIAAGGIIDKNALKEMGKALHPVMDATSPAHANQVYEGIPSNIWSGPVGLLADVIGMYRHIKAEAKITLDQYHKNIDNVRREYLKTFGDQDFFRATGCRKVESCPYDDSQLKEALRAK